MNTPPHEAQALPEAEQKAIYAAYAELNKTKGVAPGLPLRQPHAARTVQVLDGKTQVKNGTYLAEGAGGYFVFEAENMEAAIALAAVVLQCYVEGVSTRRVDDVARSMGLEGISKSQVSRICAELDEVVEEVARLSGVPTTRTTVLAHVICSLCAGLAG